MEEKNKTIGISALITLGIVTLSLVLPNFFDEPKYYCEARPELGFLECDGFSKYVSPEGKCLRPEGNKVCREGWKLVTDDRSFDAEPVSVSNSPRGIGGRQELCSHSGCRLVK